MKIIDIGNEYIHASEISGEINGKAGYSIVNNKSNSDIACVAYYKAWKRYVMFTDVPAVFDRGCLLSIVQFIDKVNAAIK